MVEHVPYTAEQLVKLASLEDSHFWFLARGELLKRLVLRFLGTQKDFMELGCGTGKMLRLLSSQGLRVSGVDLHPAGPQFLESTLPGHGPFLTCSAECVPRVAESVDGLAMFDVLEHLREAPVLSECYRLLRPGGLLFVSVPAHQWLFSEFDRRAGHLRRYGRKQLAASLSDHGFEMLYLTGYQCFLAPLFVLQRLMAGARPTTLPHPWLNRLLSLVNFAEVELSSRMPLPFGTSWICVARKQ